MAHQGSHCPSAPQVCFSDCQYNSLQFPLICLSVRFGGATDLWLCPSSARAHSTSKNRLLVKTAQGKLPHLPELPREQTRRWNFPTVQGKSKVSYPGCHPWPCCFLGSSGLPDPQHGSSRAAPSCCGDSPGETALSPHMPHHPVRWSLGQHHSLLQRPRQQDH